MSVTDQPHRDAIEFGLRAGSWGWGPRYRTTLCTCDACGVDFWATRYDAQYCSNACRQRAYRKRKLGA
jgi:hypothetical protein